MFAMIGYVFRAVRTADLHLSIHQNVVVQRGQEKVTATRVRRQNCDADSVAGLPHWQ